MFYNGKGRTRTVRFDSAVQIEIRPDSASQNRTPILTSHINTP